MYNLLWDDGDHHLLHQLILDLAWSFTDKINGNMIAVLVYKMMMYNTKHQHKQVYQTASPAGLVIMLFCSLKTNNFAET